MKHDLGTTQAVHDCHELLAWLLPRLDRMPRVRRFTLGERIETLMLQVLENLIEASYTAKPATPLKRANLKLDVARHLWRLAERVDAVPRKHYLYGAQEMVALGQQIGGWRKFTGGGA